MNIIDLMRIFYICYENFGIEGAATTHVREVTENFKAMGHQVHIFAPTFRKFRFPVGVEITYIPLLPLWKFKEAGFYFCLWFVLIYFWFKKGVDIVYVREMTLNIVPYLFSRIFRKKMLVEINGTITEELKLAGFSHLKVKLIALCRKINLKLCDKVVAVSPQLGEKIRQDFQIMNGKLSVVENGTNPYIFAPMDKYEARRLLGLREKAYYLCYVGRFYPYHGLDQTIYIFKHLLMYLPDSYLMLIGKGFEMNKIKQLARELGIQNRVLFLGQKLQIEIPKYISAADAGLLLFKGGGGKIPGISLKVLEYMACSRPVIAARGEESGEFVQRMNAGIVVDPANPRNAAAYIAALLTNETIKERLGNLGRNAILKNYTWKHTAQRIINIFHELQTS